MTNKRIRIGKDIAISWEINSPMDLVDTDLTIQMKDPKGNKVDIEDFELVDKTISFGLRGTAFAYLGNYTLTLWYKKGEVGQTVVDVIDAFELVGSTEQEDNGCNCGCGALDVSTVDLYGDLTFPIKEGLKGDKGEDGQPGFSPIATVSKSGDTATITITDKNGTTTATVKDGSDASITIDSTPTQNSNNAVSSGGVYNAIASKIEGPWTKLVDTILEENTTGTGSLFNLGQYCSKLKIIALFPANSSISSNTSCYIALAKDDTITTLLIGNKPIRPSTTKVITEYVYEDGIGWQGISYQFSTASFNEDGNNYCDVTGTNVRGENVGAINLVRIYGKQTPLIAGTKIQIWGK